MKITVLYVSEEVRIAIHH